MIQRYLLPTMLIALMTTGSALTSDALLVQVRCGLGDGYAKAGHWAPIEVSINYQPSDTSSVIDGEMVILPGEYRKVRYVQPLRMGQGRKVISFNILPSDNHFNDRGYCLTVQVVNRGRLIFEKEFIIPGTWMLLDSRTSMVIGIGLESLFGMQTGPLLPAVRNKESDQRQVITTWIEPVMLPVALKGFDSADVILWHDPKPTTLDKAQIAAISEFVRCGGDLVLVASPESLLTTLGDLPLPARFAGSVALSLQRGNGPLPPALGQLVFGKPGEILRAPANITIQINRMQMTGGRIEAVQQNRPLLVRGVFGRGRISMMALPLNDRLFKLNPKLRAAIVSRLIDLPTHKSQIEFSKHAKPAVQPGQYYNRRFASREPAEVANSFLTSVKELKPISVMLIILFLAAFFFLSGPLSYLVLKRKNRLEWTYPVFGIVSICFLIISYGGAYAVKGSRSFVRDVTVIDLSRDGTAEQTSYYGLFSSRPRMIQPACNGGMFVSGLGESDLRGRGYNSYTTPSLLPVAGSDLVVSAPDFTSPASIMLRQWQVQQFVATGPVITGFNLSLRKAEASEENGRVHTVANTGSIGFKKVFLITDTIIWKAGRVDPGERARLVDDVSLSSALEKAITDEQGYRYGEGELKETLELGDVIALCFPSLVKSYYRASVHLQDSYTMTLRTPGNDLSALTKAFYNKKVEPELSRWQIISCMAPVDDYQHLDMTRVLCEGGSVLIGLSDQPGSRIDTGKTNAIRTSQTIVRVICSKPQE